MPGVVAMRYNVYVVTAAQYTADLYAHLLAGRPLGQAATAARRALAADPARQITTTPVDLQDWAVPVIYEAAPLTLLRPQQRDAPLINLSATERPARMRGVGCRGRRMRGSSAAMRPCWPWTARSTPSRWCCCTRSRGRGSPRPRRSSPAGTTPPAAWTTRLIWARGRCCGPASSITCRWTGCWTRPGTAFPGCWRRTGSPGRPPPTRTCAGTWSCRCWRRCRCYGCGTTSSRSPGSRPAPPAPGPRPSKTTSRSSCATSLRRPGARCC